MFTRTIAIAALALCTMAFSGCPTGPQIRAGNWIFTFYDDRGNPYYAGGLTLNNDGTTAPYNVQGNTVHVTTGWWQTDGVFTLEQKLGSVHVWYTANIGSSMQLQGESYSVPDDAVIGTFIAVYDDPNRLEQ